MSLVQMMPSNVRNEANNIRKIKDEHESTMVNIKNLVMTLDAVWKGDAQTEFVNKFQSMDRIYKKFGEVMIEYAKLLDKAATDLENVDKKLESMVRSIS